MKAPASTRTAVLGAQEFRQIFFAIACDIGGPFDAPDQAEFFGFLVGAGLERRGGFGVVSRYDNGHGLSPLEKRQATSF